MARPVAPSFYPTRGFTKGKRPVNVSTGTSYRDVLVKDSVPCYAPRKSVTIDCEVQLYSKHVMGRSVSGGLPEIIPEYNDQGSHGNEKAEKLAARCLHGEAARSCMDYKESDYAAGNSFSFTSEAVQTSVGIYESGESVPDLNSLCPIPPLPVPQLPIPVSANSFGGNCLPDEVVPDSQVDGAGAGNLADTELTYEVEETVKVRACIGIDLQERRDQVRSLIQSDGVCKVPQ
ncbi:hypothetical protein L1987_20973 [Smallanthus sonchifolius]|uniref:Uncharacterized protein n=1 Tax=Smallanthus sonchifolius TaxID=185202 RepID=A0ACB9ISK3_9ASTR|nr:hypothetical protein L1987_20973 [Smallanthus sonchifolius]